MTSVAGRTMAPIACALDVRPAQEYLQRWSALWWAGDGEALPPGRTYSPREQRAAEAELEARSPFGYAFLERLYKKLARRHVLERAMGLV